MVSPTVHGAGPAESRETWPEGPAPGEHTPGTGPAWPDVSPSEARAAHRVAVRTFRPRRSLAAVVVSTVTVLVAGLAAAEVISSLAGAPLRFVPLDTVSEPAVHAHWNSPEMLFGSAVSAVVGLYLLLTALIPGVSSHMVLRTDDRDLAVGLSQRGLRRVVEHAARDVDGVTEVHARVRNRSVRVVARTPERPDPELRTRVASAVRERVAELAPARPVRVRTRIRRVKGELR